MTSAAAALAWRDLSLLSVRLEQNDDHACLRLAQRHDLSFYDAAYLELGLRLTLPLATRDDALTNAALAEGAALVGPSP